MVKMKATYQGQKHCELFHEPSGAVIATDAPKDNHGKGELFSPTDLTSASLLSCMLTVMAIAAEARNWSIVGSHGEVVKEMSPSPRRIARLAIQIFMPSSLNEEQRVFLEEVANTCPVKRSLHPEIVIDLKFHYVHLSS